MVSLRLVETDSAGNELNSVVIRAENPGDSYPLACSTFDLGFPAPREVTEDIPYGDGTIDTTQFHGARTVTMDVSILGNEKEYYEQEIRSFMHPSKRVWLYVNREAWDSERRMRLRPSNLSFTSSRASAAKFDLSLAFVCPSGRMEDIAEVQATLNPPSVAVNGWDMPFKFPFSFGANNSSTDPRLLLNRGNAPTYPLIYFYGFVQNPWLRNRTTNQILDLQAAGGLRVETGEYLVIDTSTKRVLLNGTDSRYRHIDFTTSSWVYLASGHNEVEFGADGIGSGAKAVIVWKNTWI